VPSARIFVSGVVFDVAIVPGRQFSATSQIAHTFPVCVTVSEIGSRTPPAACEVRPIRFVLGAGTAPAPAGALAPSAVPVLRAIDQEIRGGPEIHYDRQDASILG
jgi:hypothetical protein